MNFRNRLTLILTLSLCTIVFGSWGFLVHRTTHQLAIYHLKGDLQNFFYSNIDYLVRESVRPDIRRGKDSLEAERHFIDFEAFGDSAAWKMPKTWNEASQRYTTDTLLEYGYLPYHIITIKKKLTEAFKSGNTDSILFYAADLGHYIGDAHVPLHTSLYYDGRKPNQKGMHSLWESIIPEIEIDQFQLYSKHTARYAAKPEEEIWKVLRTSHQMVNPLYEAEEKLSLRYPDSIKFRTQIRNGKEYKSYTSGFAKEYYQLVKPSINDMMLASARMISDFWYTSWVDAGKPDLKKLTNFDKAKQHQLETEIKSHSSNGLIKDGLLKAKQNQERREN